MARRPRRRRFAGTIAMLLILLAGTAAVLAVREGWRVPERWNPFAPLDLRAEADWFTRFKLSRLQNDPALCFSALDRAGISYRRLPDRTEGEACGLTGGIEIDGTQTRLAGPVAARCGLIASWLMFERHALQPAARDHLGQRVRSVRHLGTYSCRRIAGSERWSEHASSNAIDIAGFTLADGRQLSLLRDWEGNGPKAAFLQKLRDEACRYFSVVLGPAYNAAHADHFHLDNGASRLCR